MGFECVECGYNSAKWMGRCPQCNEWDTIKEISRFETEEVRDADILQSGAEKLSDIKPKLLDRLKSGIDSIDRLLGGGVVDGEVALLGGPPGIGKSTLFLQLADKFAQGNRKVLYISAEESPSQVRIHADRLGIKGDSITVIGSGNLSEAEKVITGSMPDIIFTDSIQAVADPASGGAPGSLRQVKKCGQKLTALAKNKNITVFISGQITKQGDIAGPKVLEHMVDAVLYMDAIEGDLRIVNAAKNRFGSCGDFALFSLTDKGLAETDSLSPSSIQGGDEIIGQVSGCARVGSRLIPLDLQALVTASYFEYPLRRTSGFSRERLLMLTAIAAKYLGLKLATSDVYLNVSGGNSIKERGSDLGVIAAVYSSHNNIGISSRMMFLGELGLSGEVRPLRDVGERIRFAGRNGFDSVILSGYGTKVSEPNIKLKYIKSVRELGTVLGTVLKLSPERK
jgi:DNA repair protein RadA/Sms